MELCAQWTVKWAARLNSERLRLVRAVVILLATPQFVACREPTQAYLVLSTDALCSDVVDTNITIATSAELETSLPDTSTRRCSDGDGSIGSLAVVPSGGDSDSFSVRVVTGLGKSADSCIEDKYLGGCIVARRSVHYLPHQTIFLPVEMSVICRDVPCGATETCKNGHCVDATIADVASCRSPRGCDVAAGGVSATGGTLSTNPSSIGTGGSVNAGIGSNTGQGGTSATRSVSGGGQVGLGGFAQGGSTALGGAANGGMTDSGGTYSPGGTSAIGGNASTTGGISNGVAGASQGGRAPATGGIGLALGGEMTGGTSFGGAPTGGTGHAGVASGGSATAGATALGGTSSGGGITSTGGVAGSTGLPAFCGDALVNPYAGEYCDTAGYSATCNANCTPQRCGDGLVNSAAGEACDGSTSVISCTPTCRISSCGDGYVDTLTGEQCEVGMTGCTACRQDVAGLTNALRVRAVRDELLPTTLGLNLTITNSGPTVAARDLTLRYYYTPDSASTQTISCGLLDANCNNVSMRVKALAKACANASHFAEISVTANSNLTSGSNFDIQGSINGGLLALYNFANDYSRPAGLLLSAETQTITLFQNGTLVWGKPPCGCGNGALESGEACDHSGESAACNADCTRAVCGDGKVNATAGETCDEGRPSLTCDPVCHATGLPATAAPALLQWLDASQASYVQLNPRISVVSDRSGKSNHVGQTNSSKQPFWFPNAFGSLPAIFFDGETHELAALSSVNDLGRGSIFIVHRVVPVGISATLIGNGWFSSGGGFAVRTRTQLDGLGISLGSSIGFGTTQWTLGALTGNGPPSARATYLAWDPPGFAWATGTDSALLTVTVTYASTSNPLALGGIGALEPYRGWIGEVLVFDRILSTSDRDAILSYLRQKWTVI